MSINDLAPIQAHTFIEYYSDNNLCQLCHPNGVYLLETYAISEFDEMGSTVCTPHPVVQKRVQ